MSAPETSAAEYDYLFKIMMIGEDCVGKTSLLRRFAGDGFSLEVLVTIGVDFQIRHIEIDSKRCKLEVWDTSGIERFQPIVSSFYPRAHGIMVCFDLTEMLSFEHVDTWLSESKRFCINNTPVYLVGTKADLKSKRAVTNEAIQAFCSKNNLSYIETSAMTNENVEECFTTFARMLIARRDQMQMDHTSSDIDNKNINVTVHRKPVSDESARGYKIKENCSI